MKKCLINILESAIRLLDSKKIEKSNSSISSLAPRVLTNEDEVKKIQPYLDSLKKGIDEEKILNIALTGPYGSGKSTVIKTFQHSYSEYSYLNISLASFDSKRKEDDNFNRRLEISILQQIFYHVKPYKIPDSRFKRIVNIKNERVILISIFFIFWLISTLLIFKFEYINKLNPQTWNINFKLDWVALLVFIVYFTGIGSIVKNIVRFLTNSKISKFNIKGELELGENSDKSVFNQYLEEIIYFFERTDYNVVVVEDLDRFENTDIFVKLREVNTLLNNSNCINRDIIFLYAIRDEFFTDKNERVKFFEYIIPVIPFINPSNAGEQLTKLINEANLNGVLSTDFTEDVITFIDDIDMRLLINIFHEYRLYKDSLDKSLQQDNLFAIILYKNMHPDDFGKLHKRQGNLYTFLSKKNYYIKELLKNIDDKINSKELEIDSINNEIQDSITELKAIYINAIHSIFPNAVSFTNTTSEVTFEQLMEDNNFEDLIEDRLIPQIYRNVYGNISKINHHEKVTFLAVQNKVNPNIEYKDRMLNILNKNNNKIDLLKREIAKLNSEKNEIKSWSLKEIFEKIDIDPFLQQCYNNEQDKKNHFYNNQLIRNLIINGYINENYNDYISIFHGINLTQDDHTFEKKIKGGIMSPFDFPLTKVENLIKKIPDRYFKREFVFNYDLLDYLALNYDLYSDKYNTIISILSNEKESSREFFKGYTSRKNHLDLFIKRLSKSWKGFWVYLEEKSKYPSEEVETYLELILLYTDLEDIVNLDQSNMLSNYLKERYGFLSEISNKKKIREVIRELDIKFTQIESQTDGVSEMFDFVFEGNYYQINISNITFILKKLNIELDDADIRKCNYTYILSSGNNFLSKYINDNINEYLKKVFLLIPENSKEAEDSLLCLLNNDVVNRKLKSSIIDKQSRKLTDLSQIFNPEIQQDIFVKNKIASKWENILTFYNLQQSITDSLIDFVNIRDNATELSNIKIPTLVNNQNIYGKFWEELIQQNDIDDECYDLIVKSSPWWYSDLSIDQLSEAKVKSLIRQKVINPTKESYALIKDYSKSLGIFLIERHKSAFIKIADEVSWDCEDINQILKSETISNSEKQVFINNCDEGIIAESNENLKLLNQIILNDQSFLINDSLIEEIILEKRNPSIHRVKLFNRYSAIVTSLGDFINSLSNDYSEIGNKKKRCLIPNTNENKTLLEILQKRDYISSFRETSKGFRVFHSSK